jgi:hypothetical protein
MEAELNVCYTTSNAGRRGVDLWSNGRPVVAIGENGEGSYERQTLTDV